MPPKFGSDPSERAEEMRTEKYEQKPRIPDRHRDDETAEEDQGPDDR